MLIVFFAIVGLVAIGVVATRRNRAAVRARLRVSWGRPIERERQMGAMAASHRARLAYAGSGESLDTRTWDDLNLDAVFAAIDRTESTLGQHALYHRLRTAPIAHNLEVFERLVSRFEIESGPRERAQQVLSRLRDPHGYDLWWLGRQDAIETQSWYVLFPVLTVATLLLFVLSLITPQIVPALVAALVINVIVRFATDRLIQPLAVAFRQVAPVVATAESLQFLPRDDVQPLIGSIGTDVPHLSQLKTISRWIGGDPLLLSMRAGSLIALLNDVISTVYEYLNLVLLLDGNGVYFGARGLRAHRGALLRTIMAMGEVDASISVASFRAGRSDWTRPRFLEPGTPAKLIDVRHPLVLDAVPNTISLAPGRGVLITGSNMSGKSTFLRTVGVTAVLAQTLNTCLAAEYQAPVFNVRSCIGRSDDLLTGRSYYIVEVESLLELVSASSTSAGPHLFLLDELFRGTNAVERIAAGQAVLLQLVGGSGAPRRHVVLAATHDGELVDLVPDRYDPFHFGDSVGADGLIFDHQLRPGAASTRNAIALLRLHGAPRELIQCALTCAAILDAQRGSTLQSR